VKSLSPPLPLSRGRFVEGASLGVIGPLPVNITGRRRMVTAVNGSVPAPILRFRESDMVTNVTNRLEEPTSIHWHGAGLPNVMVGVPGLTLKGIMPGEGFTYRDVEPKGLPPSRQGSVSATQLGASVYRVPSAGEKDRKG
jgi:hypothetical protein